jgi:hypothetical protein
LGGKGGILKSCPRMKGGGFINLLKGEELRVRGSMG